MATLKVLKGANAGESYELDRDRIVLGRDPRRCDVVLRAGAVSRQHARLVREGDAFFVEDLQSRNGTFVNGKQVATGTLMRLKDQDRIKICDMLLIFHDASSSGVVTASELAETPSGAAHLKVQEDKRAGSSTILTSLDVSSSSDIRVEVRPEAKLRAVLEISQNLGKSLALDEILPRILDSLFKIFPQADRGCILLAEGPGKPMVPAAIKHRHERDSDSIKVSRTVINQVMTERRAVLSADAASDERFELSQSIADFRIRSLMVAPLTAPTSQPLGVIHLDTLDHRRQFSEDDLDVLVSVAVQAGQAVENANLHEALLEQERRNRELATARDVQRSFLPTERPQLKGYRFFDYYEAAYEVGGDYFGYIPLPDGRLAVALGDVAGKGMPAALLMARLCSEVRYCLVTTPTPADAVTRLNRELSGPVLEDRFITFLLCVLDPREHTLTVVNAGHMAPLLRRNQPAAAAGKKTNLPGTPTQPQLLEQPVEEVGSETAGLPLGIAPDRPYSQTTTPLASGDLVVIYTDGISEALNPADETYGIDAIRKVIATGPRDVEELGDALLEDVHRFVQDRAQSDDICLLCFGRE